MYLYSIISYSKLDILFFMCVHLTYCQRCRRWWSSEEQETSQPSRDPILTLTQICVIAYQRVKTNENICVPSNMQWTQRYIFLILRRNQPERHVKSLSLVLNIFFHMVWLTVYALNFVKPKHIFDSIKTHSQRQSHLALCWYFSTCKEKIISLHNIRNSLPVDGN